MKVKKLYCLKLNNGGNKMIKISFGSCNSDDSILCDINDEYLVVDFQQLDRILRFFEVFENDQYAIKDIIRIIKERQIILDSQETL